MTNANNFPKNEKLCGEIRIGKLYKDGKAFLAFPMRVVYVFSDEKTVSPLKLVISVPKKKFKRAVDRNRIKRLMREAFRLQKNDLVTSLEKSGLYLHTGISIITEKIPDYSEISSKMGIILQKLTDIVNQKTEN